MILHPFINLASHHTPIGVKQFCHYQQQSWLITMAVAFLLVGTLLNIVGYSSIDMVFNALATYVVGCIIIDEIKYRRKPPKSDIIEIEYKRS